MLDTVTLIRASSSSFGKRNIFVCWPHGQLKDDVETEMWKQTDSEMDLHSRRGGGDGEGDGEEEEDEEEYRKYSSEITLCVKPDLSTESLE